MGVGLVSKVSKLSIYMHNYTKAMQASEIIPTCHDFIDAHETHHETHETMIETHDS